MNYLCSFATMDILKYAIALGIGVVVFFRLVMVADDIWRKNKNETMHKVLVGLSIIVWVIVVALCMWIQDKFY